MARGGYVVPLGANMSTNVQTVSAGTAQNPAHSEVRFNLPLVATRPEVATLFGCTQRHLSNLERRGLLRSTRLGRCVRYRRESVLKCLETLEG